MKIPPVLRDAAMQERRITRRALLFGFWGWLSIFRRRRTAKLAGIQFEIVRHGPSRWRYLWVHGNERTARQILLEHLQQSFGAGFLIESSQRYVPLEGGRIDPNRMFSRVGAEKNLRLLNPDWSPDQIASALDRLDKDRPKFLKKLLPPPGGVLVALHNNSEGYSVRDEVPISDRTSLRDEDHPHEFLLCTDPADFDRLSLSPFNVVLQQSAPPEDDGSLSRLASKRGVRYVNIEAALGNAAGQRQMLDWVERNLP
jgi:hypothetical protein